MNIYHIVTPEVWEKFKDKDFYEAESLKTEGFIHCSFAEQLDGVLQRYYKDARKVFILTLRHGKTDFGIGKRTFDQQRNLSAYLWRNQQIGDCRN